MKRAALALLIGLFFGCATTGPLGPIDLSAPGWETRQAQAIWRPDSDKPEIVGDLLVATQAEGSAFVQFSKTFPIASARISRDRWAIEFPPQHRRYSGRGSGPGRVVWIQLLRVLDEKPAAAPWSVMQSSPDVLLLKNDKTGESLEVHF